MRLKLFLLSAVFVMMVLGSYFSMATVTENALTVHCGAFIPTRTPTPGALDYHIYMPLVLR
ncbi:MAG: hypothetical protein JXA21_10405 [Anaerolineae bacterium]|nr:hypothetical protein [Anaerolineae bacterium]